MANLAVRYTVAKEGYGEKFAETTFRLVVEDPSAISGSTVHSTSKYWSTPSTTIWRSVYRKTVP